MSKVCPLKENLKGVAKHQIWVDRKRKEIDMLGAIIGDIVGSRFEFNNTHRLDFELFTNECSFTDDTICTVAVADAIL